MLPQGKYLGTSHKSDGAVLLLRKEVEAIQVALHKPSLDGRTVWTMERSGPGSLHLLDAMLRTAGLSTPELATYTILGPPLRYAHNLWDMHRC